MRAYEDRFISNVFLKPGELFITHEPTVISTVLGSCISVTMFNPRFKVGGMCHALLPTGQDAAACNAFRFVDMAIPYMIEGFGRFGIKRHDIEVKLFGGSDVLATIDRDNAPATVGAQNVERALQVIEKEKLHLIADDVRGTQGRKILFHTYTGDILLKRIRKSDLHGAF